MGYYDRNVSNMTLGEIEREIGSIQSIATEDRTPANVQRLEELCRARDVVRNGWARRWR